MDKLLKYEVYRKWKIVLISTIAIILALATNLVDSLIITNTRFFAGTLNFSTMPSMIHGQYLGLLTQLMWWVSFMAGIDLYLWLRSDVSYMIPINRGSVLNSKVIFYLAVYILLDLVFIVAMMVKNGGSIDYRNYIVILFITITELMNLMANLNYLTFFAAYISKLTIWVFIFLNTTIGYVWFIIGKHLFYNKNVRFDLESMRFQSMNYVEKINGNILTDRIINEGLDIGSLVLGLIVSLIIFCWCYKLMEERV